MCGLAGGINQPASLVRSMLKKIEHRGGDGQGIIESGTATHGHVRLALLDLTEASSQPFKYHDTVLSFNGEIWNYRELRSELENRGVKFHTTGDTEVLAAMLYEYGKAALCRLEGMFSFIWTGSDGKHFAARDAFGEIPLYIGKSTTGFIWASERKAFPPTMVPTAVPAGSLFCFDSEQWEKWYSLPDHEGIDAKQVLTLLRQGVERRVNADAEVACLISGGIDSSLILALAKEANPNITAFTAVFNPDSTDLKSARKLCNEIEVPLVEVPVTVDRAAIQVALETIEISSKAQIEIAALCIPLAQRIASEGFKACLSGEAADELFGGYGNFCIAASKTDDVVPLRIEQLRKMSRGNFIRCNKSFMAAGVECRLPFMEQKLVEQSVQASKSESPLGKKLLKEAAKATLPAWVIKRPKDTFQGGSGVSAFIASEIANPVRYYNNELKKKFGYLPKN